MLLDLAAVTRTLITLVTTTVKKSSAWPTLQPLQVVALPPDKLAGDGMIGVYLYHLTEDAQFKNLPPAPGGDEVRFTSMALNLHYVVSAHVDNAEGSDLGTQIEQLMMGLAVKGLRDYPIIDAKTKVAGVTILDAKITGEDTRLRVSLQPVPAQDAVSYWTAGSSPLRLSAYYQVQVVLLEPEDLPPAPGRVLVYGVDVFVGGVPHLLATRNTITFTLPGETSARSVAAQPAQVAVGDTLDLLGSGLEGGSGVLLVQAAGWADAAVADTWGFLGTTGGGFAKVQATAGGRPVLPGIYAAKIRVDRSFTQPDGTIRVVSQTSNAAPFTVVPGILPGVAGISAPDPTGVFTITGTGYAPAAAIELYLGETRLAPGVAGALNPGEFAVLSATQVQARLVAGMASGQSVALRLLVSGAMSQPRWVRAP